MSAWIILIVKTSNKNRVKAEYDPSWLCLRPLEKHHPEIMCQLKIENALYHKTKWANIFGFKIALYEHTYVWIYVHLIVCNSLHM